jgi:hypothetical protein
MNLEEKLFHGVLEKRNVILTPDQSEKLRYACKKAILENPGLGYEGLLTACNIYLNLILSSPTIDLGPIIQPKK